jgi:hypothetical protein
MNVVRIVVIVDAVCSNSCFCYSHQNYDVQESADTLENDRIYDRLTGVEDGHFYSLINSIQAQ